MLKLINKIKLIVVESRMTVQPRVLKGREWFMAERENDLSHWKGMLVFDASEKQQKVAGFGPLISLRQFNQDV